MNTKAPTIRRCDKVVLQCVVTAYDAEGFPVGEEVNQAQTVMLRGNSLDAMIADLNASLARPAKKTVPPRTGPPPMPPQRSKKRRR